MNQDRSSPRDEVGAYETLPIFRLDRSKFGINDNTSGTVVNHYGPKGKNLLSRNQPLLDWVTSRGNAGLFQFGLAWKDLPNTKVICKNPFQQRIEGLNFTTVDYLGLSPDPRIAEAAIRAARDIGVHSVSVGGLMGNYSLSEQLEQSLCEWLGYKHCVLFPTGWAASFGAIAGLIRAHDFVVMDEFAHASLQQAAYAVTDNVVKFRHVDNVDAAQKINAVRKADADAAILVVTEGMYSMDGDIPDLGELLKICRNADAALIVDICHDLAASGPSGTGTLGKDGILGQVDVVVGGFSKALCANGGFMLVNEPAALWAVKFFGGSFTFSTALSPVQVAAALEAIRITRSAEGDELRRRLGLLSALLRNGLVDRGFKVYGGTSDSHIVPLYLGGEGFGRVAGGRAFELGLVATVIEFPAVPRGAARYRFSMRPSYTEDQIAMAIELASRAFRDAEEYLNATRS